ncbi:hypothetical protein I317_07004 [Kwoniella heveanensis CBS 569]|nr:hypothetical protein I317_07004 [Kwoniella heveanensis CBS 569]
MSTSLAPPPALSKLSHPALFSNGLATPPLTPLSPTAHSHLPPAAGVATHPHKRSQSAVKVKAASPPSAAASNSATRPPGAETPKMPPPVPSYALLRSNHALALRYVIAKLRWDQVTGQYIPGQDADWNHDHVIAKLEKELRGVEAAQKGLDKFSSICYAPTADPKPHGPKTREEDEEAEKVEIELQRMADAKLNEQYPFLKQLFIGPMTKQQARNDKLLREQLREGDWEDVSLLLPSENLRNFLAKQQKRAAPAAAGVAGGAQKKSYEQVRYEKEKAKVAAYLQANPTPALLAFANAANSGANANRKVSVAATAGPDASKKRIGPLTKEEWHATLPVYGPPTKGEAMLPLQRAQRAQVIRLLQKPWGQYNERAAGAIEALAELAKERFEEEKKAKVESEAVKAKGTNNAIPEAGAKKAENTTAAAAAVEPKA